MSTCLSVWKLVEDQLLKQSKQKKDSNMKSRKWMPYVIYRVTNYAKFTKRRGIFASLFSSVVMLEVWVDEGGEEGTACTRRTLYVHNKYKSWCVLETQSWVELASQFASKRSTQEVQGAQAESLSSVHQRMHAEKLNKAQQSPALILSDDTSSDPVWWHETR